MNFVLPSQRNAIIVADMLTTALVKVDMHWDRDDFNKAFIEEFERFNHDGEWDEIIKAVVKWVSEEGIKAKAEYMQRMVDVAASEPEAKED